MGENPTLTKPWRPVVDSLQTERLFRLTDRVAIVTGGTRGIGRAIAAGFAAAGAKIVVASRKPEAVREAENQLRERGADVLGVVAHMGDLDQVQALIGHTAEHFGGIDIVVNNAATPLTLPVGQHTPQAWAKSYDVNLRGPVFLVEAAIPHLQRSSHAVVVNVLSAGAFLYSPNTAMYSGAKAAMLSWTLLQFLELLATPRRDPEAEPKSHSDPRPEPTGRDGETGPV
jgi:NAD(P)-dependent dehydrogenase (short-subunit alcohol dehydrogenase family)